MSFSDLANNVSFHQHVIGHIDDSILILTFRYNETVEKVLREAQESLTIWQKVLQITGGDLEISKCIFSFLGLKLEKGGRVIVKIKDFEGDIIMTNKVYNIQVDKKIFEATEADFFWRTY